MTGRLVLEATDVRVDTARGVAIIDGVSLSVHAGEIVAVVGESGSGKTTAALSLLGYARRGARIVRGAVSVDGEPVLGRNAREQRRLRGKRISYVPQDPATSLNPSRRVRDQVAGMLHEHFPDRDTAAELPRALERVGLPTAPEFMRRYPHQLSGGQQQRVAIAIALICEPPVIVLDEPTTALDVVTQAHILEEVKRLQADLGVGMVYVSHDLAVVSELADRVAVMHGGRIVEEGPAARVLEHAEHPYTRGLLGSVLDYATPHRFAGRSGHDLDTRNDAPLLDVGELCAAYPSRQGPVTVLEGVSFSVGVGETVAVVGESGSGKTTSARCVVGLHAPASGRVLLDGEPLAPTAGARTPEQRRRIQMVFQNPYASLNPRHSVGGAVARSAQLLLGLSARDAEAETRRLIELVRLPARLLGALPGELSGGERQRIAIARALIARPDLLVCDEITSALDVSVQAAVLEVLAEVQRELRLSLLFITHDLAVVASIASRMVVLEHGQVREHGLVDEVLAYPRDDYTRRLIDAVPRLENTDPDVVGEQHEA